MACERLVHRIVLLHLLQDQQEGKNRDDNGACICNSDGTIFQRSLANLRISEGYNASLCSGWTLVPI